MNSLCGPSLKDSCFQRLCVMAVVHMRDRWLTRWIKVEIYCPKSNSHLAQTHGKSHLFLPAPCGLTLGLIGDLTPITAEAGPPRCWWCVRALKSRRILSPGLFGGGSMASPTSLSHPEHSTPAGTCLLVRDRWIQPIHPTSYWSLHACTPPIPRCVIDSGLHCHYALTFSFLLLHLTAVPEQKTIPRMLVFDCWCLTVRYYTILDAFYTAASF